MNATEVLQKMDEGWNLYSSFLGFWLFFPKDQSSRNVHHGAAKSLVRRKLIMKAGEGQWVKVPTVEDQKKEILDRINYFYRKIDGTFVFPNSAEGDLLKLVHRLLNNHPLPS